MKKLVGVLIILLGVMFLLSNFDIVIIKNIRDLLFAVFLMLLGIGGIATRKSLDYFFVSIIIFGFLLLLNFINVIDSNSIWLIFFPIIIIEVGLSFIFKPKKKEIILTDNSKFNAFFSGIEEKVISKEYTNSQISAIFGGCEVDYRDINIKDEIGYISIKAIFGGVTIFVPKDVNIEVQGTPIAGGVENKTNSNSDAKKTLIIDYTVIFGGIEIKN